MSELQTFLSTDLRPSEDVSEVYRGYSELMREMHGDEFILDQRGFRLLIFEQTELICFVYEEQRMVATAHGSLSQAPPFQQVLLLNIHTRHDHRFRGHATLATLTLMRTAKKRWGSDEVLRFFFTNNPSKGNAGFYESLGFTNRGPNSPNPTELWEMYL